MRICVFLIVIKLQFPVGSDYRSLIFIVPFPWKEMNKPIKLKYYSAFLSKQYGFGIFVLVSKPVGVHNIIDN